MMAFHGSSFCRYPFTAQSKVENNPPQTPKFPPKTGARAFMADMEPSSRSPYQNQRSPSHLVELRSRLELVIGYTQ